MPPHPSPITTHAATTGAFGCGAHTRQQAHAFVPACIRMRMRVSPPPPCACVRVHHSVWVKAAPLIAGYKCSLLRAAWHGCCMRKPVLRTAPCQGPWGLNSAGSAADSGWRMRGRVPQAQASRADEGTRHRGCSHTPNIRYVWAACCFGVVPAAAIVHLHHAAAEHAIRERERVMNGCMLHPVPLARSRVDHNWLGRLQPACGPQAHICACVRACETGRAVSARKERS